MDASGVVVVDASGVVLDGVVLDGVVLDGVVLDGVLDGVVLDGVVLDVVPQSFSYITAEIAKINSSNLMVPEPGGH